MPISKQSLRQQILHKRKRLTNADQERKSKNIVNTIINTAIFRNAGRIATYYAIAGEANPKALQTCTHKHFYLPILAKDKTLALHFAPVDETTQFKNNLFSIPEPICDPNKYISAESLDLVIMPLLGFDLKGNRLGMGGGYYDRCFSFKKNHLLKPILLGFAYDFQEVDEIITEPWDIGFDYIATETRLIECQS